MCDTIVVTPGYSATGRMLFAKNSDRSPNEPQYLQHFPAADHDLSEEPEVRLTYISVSQAEHTNEIVISRPSWMWGAEFGFNEFGLNIGNEAVWTKEKYLKTAGLTGMDALRLALERCSSAYEALKFIIALFEKYPQGGNCGYDKNFYYHNSFLIADPAEAYVLETAGRYWVYKKVEGCFAISNCLCLDDYDECHPGLISNAVRRGRCRSQRDFGFVRCYQDRIVTAFAKGRERRALVTECLGRGKPDVRTLMETLRTHGGRARDGFAEVGSVCMHAGGPIGDQTTASYVAEIDEKGSSYFVTGSSMPCMSMFKPLLCGRNAYVAEAGEEQKGLNFWLTREKLRRCFISGAIDPGEYVREIRAAEETCLEDFLSSSPADRRIASENAFEQEERILVKYLAQARGLRTAFTRGSPYYRRYWTKRTETLMSEAAEKSLRNTV